MTSKAKDDVDPNLFLLSPAPSNENSTKSTQMDEDDRLLAEMGYK